MDVRYDVLGECPVDSVPRELYLGTVCDELGLGSIIRERGLTHFETLSTEFTIETTIGDPLYTDSISNFDIRPGSVFSDSYNLAYTFMSPNKRYIGLDGPITLFRMKVGVAYSRVLDLDEAFTRSEV